MHWYVWLVIGTVVGLLARPVMGGDAYGVVTDVLLGAVGALAASWILLVPNVDSRLSWAGKSSLVVWGAASLPLLARIVAKQRSHRKVPLLRRSAANTQLGLDPPISMQRATDCRPNLVADTERVASSVKPITDHRNRSDQRAS